MSLAKIVPASEFRKAQSEDAPAATLSKEDRDKRDAEFVKRFKTACDKYRELLLEEVAKALETAKRFSKTHTIINSKVLMDPCDGFAYTSIVYGFWNKTTKKFEDTVFTKNEIKKPFDVVKEELAKLGYTLEDITDRSRSNKLFLKLSW